MNKVNRAWIEGVAATSSGKVVLNQVNGEADVVNFKIKPASQSSVEKVIDASTIGPTADILLANAKKYKIVHTALYESDGRIAYMILEYMDERRLIKCYYDEVIKDDVKFHYLRRVGGCVVEGIEHAHLEDNLKLQDVTIYPRYGDWDKGDTADVVEADYNSGYDGIKSVTLMTSPTLLPENIKAGVNIYGVKGTATGGAGLKTVDFTSETGALTAELDDGSENAVIPTKDTSGKIASVSVNGGTMSVEYDSDGRLLKVGSVDVRNIGIVDLPKNGNIMRF